MKKIFLSVVTFATLLSAVGCNVHTGSTNQTTVSTESITSEIITTEQPGTTDVVTDVPTYDYDMENDTLFHIVLLGQSLSLGWGTGTCLKPCEIDGAYMFKQVRTQDFGYVFDITRDEYKNNWETYDAEFYKALFPLAESGGKGNASMKWEVGTSDEFESPATGIVEGLNNAYISNGYDGLPYKVLVSAPGIGGTPIDRFMKEGAIYERTAKDIENGKRLAVENGLKYKVLAFIWMQGESDFGCTASDYQDKLKIVRNTYNELAKNITDQTEVVPFITYQNNALEFAGKYLGPVLAQYNASVEVGCGIAVSAPCYQFEPAADKVHLMSYASRDYGRMLGWTLYEVLHGEYEVFAPKIVTVTDKTAVLEFSAPIMLEPTGVYSTFNRDVVLQNNGFFCLDAANNVMDCTINISDDGLTVTITCTDAIKRITYGYNPAEGDTLHTYGGTLCKTETIEGYLENRHQYMPIQDIYKSID